MRANSFEDDTKKRARITGLLTIIVVLITASYVNSLIAFVAPSQEHRWDTDVNSIVVGSTVDITGLLDEKGQFIDPGQYYYYFSSTENVQWSIIVIDPNNTPVHYETGTLTNAMGDIITPEVSFTAPSVTGTYTVRYVVWTDYLPDGETRTNLVNEDTFEVV